MYHANSPAKYFQLNLRLGKSGRGNSGLIVKVSRKSSRTFCPRGAVSRPTILHECKVSTNASEADETPDFLSDCIKISVVFSIVNFDCEFIDDFAVIYGFLERLDFFLFVFYRVGI